MAAANLQFTYLLVEMGKYHLSTGNRYVQIFVKDFCWKGLPSSHLKKKTPTKIDFLKAPYHPNTHPQTPAPTNLPHQPIATSPFFGGVAFSRYSKVQQHRWHHQSSDDSDDVRLHLFQALKGCPGCPVF